MRHLLVLACACSQPTTTQPRTATVPSPAALAPAPAKCNAPEHRQLDFWIGDWDVRIRARSSPTSDTWGEARGTQHIESILSGCAIAEHFSADGPGIPWAGKSYSAWQPKLGKWRQAWVDDGGNYLAFTGGVEAGATHGTDFVLYGEPFTPKDKPVQMRMVFSQITPDSLHWAWQRTEDGWATSTLMMEIEYRRAERTNDKRSGDQNRR